MPIIEDKIHPLVSSLIPEHLKEYSSALVAFIEEYYKWQETEGQVLFHARDLIENRDVDTTLDSFLVRFKEKYLVNFDFETVINKRMLIKHAQDLYRTKGTERGIKLFFKLVFGEDPDIYYPADDLMRLSDSDWQRDQYLELEYSPKIFTLQQQTITGFISGASAFCSQIVKRRAGGRYIYVATIQDVRGNFIDGENVTTDGAIEDSPVLKGSLSELTIINGQQNFVLGEPLIVEGSGQGGIALVSNVATRAGVIDAELINGGYGFSPTPDNIISDKMFFIGTVNAAANTSFKGFELHETIVQPLATVVFPISNTSVVVGDTLTNYHANGDVKASGVVVFKTTNNSAGTTTVKVGRETGDWSSVSGNVYTQSNTFVYGITSSVYSNVSANATTLFTPNTDFIGVSGITDTFYANAIIVGSFSEAQARIIQVYNNNKLTDLSFSVTVNAASTNTETVTVNSNRIRGFLNTPLDEEYTGFGTGANSSSIIASALSYQEILVNSIIDLNSKITGNDYNFSTSVNLDEPFVRNLQKKDYVLAIANSSGILSIGEAVIQEYPVTQKSFVYHLANAAQAIDANEVVNQTNVYQINQVTVANSGAGYNVGDSLVFSGGGANSTTEPTTNAAGFVSNVGVLDILTYKDISYGDVSLSEDDVLQVLSDDASISGVTIVSGGSGYSNQATATVTNVDGTENNAATISVSAGPLMNLVTSPATFNTFNPGANSATFEVFAPNNRNITFTISNTGLYMLPQTLVLTPSGNTNSKEALAYRTEVGVGLVPTAVRQASNTDVPVAFETLATAINTANVIPFIVKLNMYISNGVTYYTNSAPTDVTLTFNPTSSLYGVGTGRVKRMQSNVIFVAPDVTHQSIFSNNTTRATQYWAGATWYIPNPANTNPNNIRFNKILIPDTGGYLGIDFSNKDGYIITCNGQLQQHGVVTDILQLQSNSYASGDRLFTDRTYTISTSNTAGHDAIITATITDAEQATTGTGEVEYIRANTSLDLSDYSSVFALSDNTSIVNTTIVAPNGHSLYIAGNSVTTSAIALPWKLGKNPSNGTILSFSSSVPGDINHTNTEIYVQTGVYVPLSDRRYLETPGASTNSFSIVPGSKIAFRKVNGGIYFPASGGFKSSTPARVTTYTHTIFQADVTSVDEYGIVINNAKWTNSAVKGTFEHQALFYDGGSKLPVDANNGQLTHANGSPEIIYTWANNLVVNTTNVNIHGRNIDVSTLKELISNSSGYLGETANTGISVYREYPIANEVPQFDNYANSGVTASALFVATPAHLLQSGEGKEYFDAFVANSNGDYWNNYWLWYNYQLVYTNYYGAWPQIGPYPDGTTGHTSDLRALSGKSIKVFSVSGNFNGPAQYYAFSPLYANTSEGYYGGYISRSLDGGVSSPSGLMTIPRIKNVNNVITALALTTSLADSNTVLGNGYAWAPDTLTVSNGAANSASVSQPLALEIGVDPGGVIATGEILFAGDDINGVITSVNATASNTTNFYDNSTALGYLNGSGVTIRVKDGANTVTNTYVSVVNRQLQVSPIYAANVTFEGNYTLMTNATISVSDASVTGETGANLVPLINLVGGPGSVAVVLEEESTGSNATHYFSRIKLKSNTVSINSTNTVREPSSNEVFTVTESFVRPVYGVTITNPGEDYFNTDTDLQVNISSNTGTGATLTANVYPGNGAILFVRGPDQSDPGEIVSFNSATDVDETNDVLLINNTANFEVGDRLLYTIPTSGTELNNLTQGDIYYVVFANDTAVAISSTEGGANIDLESANTGENHSMQRVTNYIYTAQYDLVSNTPLRASNTKPIVGITAGYSATVQSLSNTTSNTIARGVVTFANTSYAFVSRRTVNRDFQTGYTLTGVASGYTADITDIEYRWELPVAGNNAIVNTDLTTTSGILTNVAVTSSGIAYRNNETVTLRSLSNSQVFATARTNNTKQGIKAGDFKDTRSFLSSDKYILDSFYYQDYSYDIRSSIPTDKYGKTLEEVVHPAGTKYFGSVVRDVVETLGLAPNTGDKLTAELVFANSIGSNTKASNGTFYVYDYADSSLQANGVAMFGESNFSNALFAVTVSAVEYTNASSTDGGNVYFTAASSADWKDLDRTQTWYLRGSNTIIEVSANASANVRFE